MTAGLRYALAALAFASVLACARVKVESNKRQDYDKKLDRTLIVFTNLEKFGKDYREMLRDRSVAELGRRGVAASFATSDGALALDDGPSYDEQARKFGATTALVVQRVAGTVEMNTGQLLNAEFDAQLFDYESHKRVWRARIRYASGGSLVSDSERVDKMVSAIADALTKDGLLAAAPGASPATPIATAVAATTGFPHVLDSAEIAAHLARHGTIEATHGTQRFTLYVRQEGRVERVCPNCRIPTDEGSMEIDGTRGVVCFRWHTRFPDSGCYQLVQTAADRYSMRGTDQQRPIEYSAAP